MGKKPWSTPKIEEKKEPVFQVGDNTPKGVVAEVKQVLDNWLYRIGKAWFVAKDLMS